MNVEAMRQARATYLERHPITGVAFAFLATLVIGAALGLGAGVLGVRGVETALNIVRPTR